MTAPASIVYFAVTILATLFVTALVARRGASRASLYAASSNMTPLQNGIAIAGDTLSAGTVLGYVGLYYAVGVDISLYSLASLAGLCMMLVFIVRPLRRLGRFTLGDVIGSRLPDSRMRAVLGICTIVISMLYLIAQLVGAGALIALVFGLAFETSVVLIGVLMTTYVVFGGMLAATWVQIVKAVVLMAMLGLLSALAILAGDGLGALYTRAGELSAHRAELFSFGGLKLGWFSSLSLALGMVLGFMGMPHVLIRFFTVPDQDAAKRSLAIATAIIGASFLLVFLIIAPAAVALLPGAGFAYDDSGAIAGGPNMVALHLARVLGGDVLFGIMGAVVLATILAVVAGLTVAMSTAVSHDLVIAFQSFVKLSEKSELRMFRAAAFLCSAAAVGVAILFQHENLVFLAVMAFAVGASTTFPLLVMSIYWRGLTTAGAIAGSATGLLGSVALIVAGPACWVRVLGFAEPLFPSEHPALISVPLAFLVMWAVSTATARELGGSLPTSVARAQESR